MKNKRPEDDPVFTRNEMGALLERAAEHCAEPPTPEQVEGFLAWARNAERAFTLLDHIGREKVWIIGYNVDGTPELEVAPPSYCTNDKPATGSMAEERLREKLDDVTEALCHLVQRIDYEARRGTPLIPKDDHSAHEWDDKYPVELTEARELLNNISARTTGRGDGPN